MEEISVNGEKYVKASVLAKNFGYTSDYIGQLCRSGSVKATLVGRSWYVNEDSVREHRQGRYRGTSAKSKEYLRQAIEEKLTKKPDNPISPVNTRYENDERELFPSLSKENSLVKEVELTEIKPKITLVEPVEPPEKEIVIQTTPVTVRRNPNPVFRTIPSAHFVQKTSNKAQNRPVTKPKEPIIVKRTNYMAIAVLAVGFLAVEAALLMGTLGLEKRLVFTENNQAMVLYGYDMSDAMSSLQNLLVR